MLLGNGTLKRPVDNILIKNNSIYNFTKAIYAVQNMGEKIDKVKIFNNKIYFSDLETRSLVTGIHIKGSALNKILSVDIIGNKMIIPNDLLEFSTRSISAKEPLHVFLSSLKKIKNKILLRNNKRIVSTVKISNIKKINIEKNWITRN